jgi:hypothetical protein
MADAIVSIHNCFRCGGAHERLAVKKLTNPTTRWVYWTLCPATREPLLAAWEDDDDGSQRLVCSDPDPDAI